MLKSPPVLNYKGLQADISVILSILR